MDKKWLYIIIGVLMVGVIGSLVYYYFSIDNQVVIIEAPTANSVVKKVSERFDLTKDFTVFDNVEDGVLQYKAPENSYVLKIPAYVTFPVFNSVRKKEIELKIAEELGLSVEELCYLPLKAFDYRGGSISIDICLGEE